MTKNKTALVLGGGGARGMSHVGVLKILKKYGIKYDFILGVSIGAVIGAAIAIGMEPEEIEEEILVKKKKDMIKFVDLGRPTKSILKGTKIFKYIEEIVEGKEFEMTKISFYILATDMEMGEEKVLNSGSIAKAVQASISVPGIFSPVEIEGKLYFDGGVVNPTPVDVAKRLGAEKIIAVDLTMQNVQKFKNPNIINTILRSYDIIRSQTVMHRLNKDDDNLVVIKPETGGIFDSFKFIEAKRMIVKGEEAALKKIKKIKTMMEN